MRVFHMPWRIIMGLSVLLAAFSATVLAVEKPRLIVLTDIGSDPDDTGAWICHNFPQVFWIRGVDQSQALQLPKNHCGGQTQIGERAII